VAMVLVRFPVSDEEPALQPAALAMLARLGFTSVSLLRDEQTTGLVLEGWALDPARAGEAARAAAGAREGIRMLQPLMQMAISAGPAGKPNQTTGGEVRDEQEAVHDDLAGLRAGDGRRYLDGAGRPTARPSPKR
jgi:hypothetical protein